MPNLHEIFKNLPKQPAPRSKNPFAQAATQITGGVKEGTLGIMKGMSDLGVATGSVFGDEKLKKKSEKLSQYFAGQLNRPDVVKGREVMANWQNPVQKSLRLLGNAAPSIVSAWTGGGIGAAVGRKALAGKAGRSLLAGGLSKFGKDVTRANLTKYAPKVTGYLGAVAGSIPLGTSIAGSYWEEGVAHGKDPKDKGHYAMALTDGVAQSLLEAMPFMGWMKGGKLHKRVLRTALQEGGEEVIQGFLENSLKIVGWKGTENLYNDMMTGIAENFVAGALSGGLLGTVPRLSVTRADMIHDIKNNVGKTVYKQATEQGHMTNGEPTTLEQVMEVTEALVKEVDIHDDLLLPVLQKKLKESMGMKSEKKATGDHEVVQRAKIQDGAIASTSDDTYARKPIGRDVKREENRRSRIEFVWQDIQYKIGGKFVEWSKIPEIIRWNIQNNPKMNIVKDIAGNLKQVADEELDRFIVHTKGRENYSNPLADVFFGPLRQQETQTWKNSSVEQEEKAGIHGDIWIRDLPEQIKKLGLNPREIEFVGAGSDDALKTFIQVWNKQNPDNQIVLTKQALGAKVRPGKRGKATLPLWDYFKTSQEKLVEDGTDLLDLAAEEAMEGSEKKAAYGDQPTYLRMVHSAIENAWKAANDVADGHPVKVAAEMLAQIANGRVFVAAGLELPTVQDVAALFSVFRNPFLEITQVVYVNPDTNKIIEHEAITVGLPGKTVIDTIGTAEKAKRMGAQYYVLHNHPGGKVAPSKQDMTTHKSLTKDKAYRGHIILDHKDFAFINRDGTVDTNVHEKAKLTDFNVGKKPIQKPLDSIEKITDFTNNQFRNGKITLFLTNIDNLISVVYIGTDNVVKDIRRAMRDNMAQGYLIGAKEEAVIPDNIPEGAQGVIIHNTDGSYDVRPVDLDKQTLVGWPSVKSQPKVSLTTMLTEQQPGEAIKDEERVPGMLGQGWKAEDRIFPEGTPRDVVAKQSLTPETKEKGKAFKDLMRKKQVKFPPVTEVPEKAKAQTRNANLVNDAMRTINKGTTPVPDVKSVPGMLRQAGFSVVSNEEFETMEQPVGQIIYHTTNSDVAAQIREKGFYRSSDPEWFGNFGKPSGTWFGNPADWQFLWDENLGGRDADKREVVEAKLADDTKVWEGGTLEDVEKYLGKKISSYSYKTEPIVVSARMKEAIKEDNPQYTDAEVRAHALKWTKDGTTVRGETFQMMRDLVHKLKKDGYDGIHYVPSFQSQDYSISNMSYIMNNPWEGWDAESTVIWNNEKIYVAGQQGTVDPNSQSEGGDIAELAQTIKPVLSEVVGNIKVPLGRVGETTPGKGICDRTCQVMVETLKKAGFIANVKEIKAKSPVGPFQITHRVAQVVLNGAKYLIDDPQHRFIKEGGKDEGGWLSGHDPMRHGFEGPFQPYGGMVEDIGDLAQMFTKEGLYLEDFDTTLKFTDIEKRGAYTYGKIKGDPNHVVRIQTQDIETGSGYSIEYRMITGAAVWIKEFFQPEVFEENEVTLKAYKDGTIGTDIKGVEVLSHNTWQVGDKYIPGAKGTAKQPGPIQLPQQTPGKKLKGEEKWKAEQAYRMTITDAINERILKEEKADLELTKPSKTKEQLIKEREAMAKAPVEEKAKRITQEDLQRIFKTGVKPDLKVGFGKKTGVEPVGAEAGTKLGFKADLFPSHTALMETLDELSRLMDRVEGIGTDATMKVRKFFKKFGGGKELGYLLDDFIRMNTAPLADPLASPEGFKEINSFSIIDLLNELGELGFMPGDEIHATGTNLAKSIHARLEKIFSEVDDKKKMRANAEAIEQIRSILWHINSDPDIMTRYELEASVRGEYQIFGESGQLVSEIARASRFKTYVIMRRVLSYYSKLTGMTDAQMNKKFGTNFSSNPNDAMLNMDKVETPFRQQAKQTAKEIREGETGYTWFGAVGRIGTKRVGIIPHLKSFLKDKSLSSQDAEAIQTKIDELEKVVKWMETGSETELKGEAKYELGRFKGITTLRDEFTDEQRAAMREEWKKAGGVWFFKPHAVFDIIDNSHNVLQAGAYEIIPADPKNEWRVRLSQDGGKTGPVILLTDIESEFVTRNQGKGTPAQGKKYAVKSFTKNIALYTKAEIRSIIDNKLIPGRAPVNEFLEAQKKKKNARKKKYASLISEIKRLSGKKRDATTAKAFKSLEAKHGKWEFKIAMSMVENEMVKTADAKARQAMLMEMKRENAEEAERERIAEGGKPQGIKKTFAVQSEFTIGDESEIDKPQAQREEEGLTEEPIQPNTDFELGQDTSQAAVDQNKTFNGTPTDKKGEKHPTNVARFESRKLKMYKKVVNFFLQDSDATMDFLGKWVKGGEEEIKKMQGEVAPASKTVMDMVIETAIKDKNYVKLAQLKGFQVQNIISQEVLKEMKRLYPDLSLDEQKKKRLEWMDYMNDSGEEIILIPGNTLQYTVSDKGIRHPYEAGEKRVHGERDANVKRLTALYTLRHGKEPTAQQKAVWKHHRPGLAYFSMLTPALQNIILWNKANVEDTIFFAATPDVLTRADNVNNRAAGYSPRMFYKDAESMNSSNGVSQTIGSQRVAARKMRTYAEFAEETGGALKPVKNYAASAGWYTKEYLIRIHQQSIIEQFKGVRNASSDHDIAVITYTEDVRTLSEALGYKSPADFLVDQGYDRMDNAQGLTKHWRGKFLRPWVHRSVRHTINRFYLEPQERVGVIAEINKWAGRMKRLIMMMPHQFALQITSSSWLWGEGDAGEKMKKAWVNGLEPMFNPVKIAKGMKLGRDRLEDPFKGQSEDYEQNVIDQKLLELFIRHGLRAMNQSWMQEALFDTEKYAKHPMDMNKREKYEELVFGKGGLDNYIFEQYMGKAIYRYAQAMMNRFQKQNSKLTDDEAAQLAVKFVNDTSGTLPSYIYGSEGQWLQFALFARDFTMNFDRQLTGGAYGLMPTAVRDNLYKMHPNAKILNPLFHGESTTAEMVFLSPWYRKHLAYTTAIKVGLFAMLQFALWHHRPEDEREEKDKWMWFNEVSKKASIKMPGIGPDDHDYYLDPIIWRELSQFMNLLPEEYGGRGIPGVAVSKMAVPLKLIFDAWANEDYMGTPIRDPGANPGKKLAQQLWYSVKQVQPSAYKRQPKELGENIPARVGQVFGVPTKRSAYPRGTDAKEMRDLRKRQATTTFKRGKIRGDVKNASMDQLVDMMLDGKIGQEQYNNEILRRKFTQGYFMKRNYKRLLQDELKYESLYGE